MDAAKTVSEPLHGFMIESIRLVRKCNKPDRKGMVAIILPLSILTPHIANRCAV